ncbi:hypothetical protein [Faecalispora jeddahensis]|uniref:hypothetical protein n=1 Tax=Faecalispora jeddahensis TaxID=1414721 RepID=UPI0018979DA9|nr:hypothetical protein [Faecalispora jeddahensis]
MNKTKSKVLSLILASAMIVSSFSSLNFASAASSRETGKLNISGGQLNGDDEIFLVSDPDDSTGTTKTVKLDDLLGTVSIETYDHEDAGSAEFDSYNHVSGDRLVTIDKKDAKLSLKKGKSGKEVITVTYKVEDYERDEKDVTVKASKEITIYANEENEIFLGKANDLGNGKERPGDIEAAAQNEQYLDLQAYYAVPATPGASTSIGEITANYQEANNLTDEYVKDGAVTSKKAKTDLRVSENNTAEAKADAGTAVKKGATLDAKYQYALKVTPSATTWAKANTELKNVNVANEEGFYATGATAPGATEAGEKVEAGKALPTLDTKYYVRSGDAGSYTWDELTTAGYTAKLQATANLLLATAKDDVDVKDIAADAGEEVAKDAIVDAPTAGNAYYVGTVTAATYSWEALVKDTHYVEATGDLNTSLIELKGNKVFDEDNIQVADGSIRLKTKFEAEERDADGKKTHDAKLAKTGSDTLKIKLGKIQADGSIKLDSSVTNVKVEVAKKWNADIDLTKGDPAEPLNQNWDIFKKNGKTYIAKKDFDYDDKDYWKDNKDDAVSVGNYDEIFSQNSIKVLGGSVDSLKVPSSQSVTVEDGTVGDIKAGTVDVQGGSVGTIKDRATKIDVSGGKVAAIDADKAVFTITGGTVSGNVLVGSADIDADDDDVDTVLNGNVTVSDNDDDATIVVDSSSDASVTIKGTLKNEAAKGSIEINGENVSLNVVDGDYASDITFEDYTGTVKGIAGVTEQTITLNGETKITLTNKLVADTVDIEEDSRLQVADARLGSIEGEGRFAFPAGKLFIEDGIDSDVVLEITDGLVAGATAFESYENSVDGSDVTGLGFELETKSANKTTDKHVIKNVKFAGPKFDKSDLTVAKGQSATVTVANYPAGTSLPAGASIEYTTDVNEDYISVTQEGNTLTIKALDYNTSRSVDNKGTITATVVDENGNELEDYAEATVNVTVLEKQPSVVTLDTTKPVTVGTGAVYQYIAKSSTAAVLSAASSDTQIATVELFNAADPRGYKFQVKGVAVGTATITTTDANGATATLTVNVVKVDGTLRADTTTYTFAPGKVYDVKFSTTGTTAVPVVTVNGKVVSIAPRGNGVYRVTAQNPGTAFVVATVGNTHVSVKFVVANGAASVGVKGNNVSTLK